MAQKIKITCDNCGAEKKETNHWWSLTLNGSGLHLGMYMRHPEGAMHLCGERCVTVMVGRYMQGGPLVPAERPETLEERTA